MFRHYLIVPLCMILIVILIVILIRFLQLRNTHTKIDTFDNNEIVIILMCIMSNIRFYYDSIDVGLDSAIMLGETCIELGYMINTSPPSNLEPDTITHSVDVKIMESVFGSLADSYCSKTIDGKRIIDTMPTPYDIEFLEFLEDKYVELNNYVGIME